MHRNIKRYPTIMNLRDENYLYKIDDIDTLLSNKFDDKPKRYSAISITTKAIDNNDQFKEIIDLAVQEAQNKKISVLPINCGKYWVSMVVWQENGQLRALYNDPRGNLLRLDYKQIITDCGIELSDLQFQQQIDCEDSNSGVFVVDNLTKMTDFLVDKEIAFDQLSETELKTGISLKSSKIIGETVAGQERKVTTDINAVTAILRFEHANILLDMGEIKSQNISTTFRPIYSSADKKLHIPDSRPPTALGKNQGEHTTNWSAYKRAVKKIIEENAHGLELCKDQLISFFESIMLKKNKDRGSDFLTKINEVITNYNVSGRTSKQAIADPMQRHTVNRTAQDKALADMARITLSFINKLPDITHPKEGNIEAKEDQSLIILNRFDAGNASTAVQDVLSLLHYPYIPESQLQKAEDVAAIKYQGKTGALKYAKAELKTRTNDLEILSDVVARHLKALKAIYPSIITDDVENAVIKKKAEEWHKGLSEDLNADKTLLECFKPQQNGKSQFEEHVVEKMKYKRDRKSMGRPPVVDPMNSSDSSSGKNSDANEELRDKLTLDTLLSGLGLEIAEEEEINIDELTIFSDKLGKILKDGTEMDKKTITKTTLQEVIEESRKALTKLQQEKQRQ
jgi:hypothetical protein